MATNAERDKLNPAEIQTQRTEEQLIGFKQLHYVRNKLNSN